jgi:hypothetical protein
MTDDWSGGDQQHAPETSRQPDPKWPMSAAATISWLGFLVHNVADLPGQTLLSPKPPWAEPHHHRAARGPLDRTRTGWGNLPGDLGHHEPGGRRAQRIATAGA